MSIIFDSLLPVKCIFLAISDDSGAVHILYGRSTGLSGLDNTLLTQDKSIMVDYRAATGNNFGHSLAAGDTNNDGFDDLAIGVPYDSTDAGYAGIIFRAMGSSSGISEGINLFPIGQTIMGISDTPEGNDFFGWSLVYIPPEYHFPYHMFLPAIIGDDKSD